MTAELIKKVDDFTNGILMDVEDYGTCEGMDAKTIVEKFSDILPTDLCDELRIEAYKDALKADPKFFDEADTGYCPDSMVEGWGDVYLCKGWRIKEIHGDVACLLDDDAYYLADCGTMDGIPFYTEVNR